MMCFQTLINSYVGSRNTDDRLCLQSRKRDTDVENKCMDTKGGRQWGRIWEIGMDTYTLLILFMKYMFNEKLSEQSKRGLPKLEGLNAKGT